MLATARRFVWWRRMHEHIARWCLQCVVCQRTRQIRAPSNLGDSERDGAPERFEHVEADSFEVEKKHFLAIIDRYSGFVVVAPLSDQSSATAVAALTSSWEAYFGTPTAVHCDGGSEFKRHFAAHCLAAGIDLSVGQPYNSNSVARVSRAHRTLQAIVSKRRAEGSTASVESLMAEAVAALNAAPSDDKYQLSPQQLALARSARVPLAVLIDSPFVNVRENSTLKPVDEQFNGLRRAFEAQASVRNEQRLFIYL